MPLSRISVLWLIKRHIRIGQDITLYAIKTAKNKNVSLNLFRKNLIQLTGYIILLPFTIIKGKVIFIDMLTKTARMAGRLLPFFKLRYEEYKKIHGC